VVFAANPSRLHHRQEPEDEPFPVHDVGVGVLKRQPHLQEKIRELVFGSLSMMNLKGSQKT